MPFNPEHLTEAGHELMRLAQLARAICPTPWQLDPQDWEPGRTVIADAGGPGVVVVCESDQGNDAEVTRYIAAAHPDAVMGLLASFCAAMDTARDRESELKRLQDLLRQVLPVLAEFDQVMHPEEGLLPYAEGTLGMDVLEALREEAGDLADELGVDIVSD